MNLSKSLPSGFVTGRVVDDEGAPVARATVDCSQFVAFERVSVSATCDEAGRFRLGPLAVDANAMLFFDAPDQGRERREGVVVFPGIDNDLGDVAVPKGLVATGLVVDEERRPLAGATLTFQPFFMLREHSSESFGAAISIQTSSDGRFETPRLPATFISVHVRAPGRVSVSTHIETARLHSTHEVAAIELEREVVIRGRVVDPDGAPIAGARLFSVNNYDEKVTTASDGSFEFHGQGAEPDALHVRRRGFAIRYHVPVEPGVAPIIVLERAFEVTGTVVDEESGAPVKVRGIGLGMVIPEHPGAVAAVENGSEIDESGRFRLWYQEPAEYQLSAGAAGYEPGRLALGRLDPPADRHGVVLRMRRSTSARVVEARAAVVGRVVGHSTGAVGLASVWYQVAPFGPGNLPMHRGAVVGCDCHPYGLAAVASDGTFRLEDVGGSPIVRVDRPGGPSLVTGPLAIHRGEELRVEFAETPRATLSGRFISVPPEITGEVWVVLSDPRALASTARVGRDGRFKIEVEAGHHALRAGCDALVRPAPMPRVHADSEERDRDVRERSRPLFEVDLAPGEIRDLGDVDFAAR